MSLSSYLPIFLSAYLHMFPCTFLHIVLSYYPPICLSSYLPAFVSSYLPISISPNWVFCWSPSLHISPICLSIQPCVRLVARINWKKFPTPFSPRQRVPTKALTCLNRMYKFRQQREFVNERCRKLAGRNTVTEVISLWVTTWWEINFHGRHL